MARRLIPNAASAGSQRFKLLGLRSVPLLMMAVALVALQSGCNGGVAYYDVGTSAKSSAAGYGGPGSSGGSGDNTVRVVNTTAFAGCAMFYVFDDNEELQTCCGCPITRDGMRTLSVINDLTSNFGVNKGNLNAGVINLVSALPNFVDPIPSPGPAPVGTNGNCSPTGAFSNDQFNRVSPIVTAPGAGMAWITHNELMQPGNIAGGKAVRSSSANEFQGLAFRRSDINSLAQRCSKLLQNSSGAGACACGAGDNVAQGGRTHAQ